MRRIPSLATLVTLAPLLAAIPLTVAAQDVRIMRRPDIERLVRFGDDTPKIGVTTVAESERGDTLGLRIEAVRKDSPADRAGLKGGDRLQSVNGLNLRASREDAGEDDYSGVLNRRLVREIEKTREGEGVELRVLSGGQVRTVRVTPVKGSVLMASDTVRGPMWRTMASDRAVLGISITSTGSVRDTIGVFVHSVTEGGPAEKAGIIEGDRIAAINGVSVRVAREDADDDAVGHARVERLQREIAKLKAGDAAELTVVTAGRSRSVRVTAVKASELPEREDEMTFLRTALRSPLVKREH